MLKPGLYVRVRFVVRDAVNAILVPETAIQQLQGTESVLLAGPDNKVEQRTVTTGDTVGSEEIVNSGLQAGDRLIVEGTQQAQPGMTVKVEVEPQQLPSPTGLPQESSGTVTSQERSSPTSSSASGASATKLQGH